MTKQLLVDADAAEALISEGDCRVFDCRFDLAHPNQGKHSYLAAHIPGAVYAHLDDNLSGKVTSKTGRHPLPNPRSFASFLARSGWEPGMRIIAYDAQGGAFAVRLWWLMKYFGHDCVSLLDGGFSAWRNARKPIEPGEPTHVKKSSELLSGNSEMLLENKLVASSIQIGDIVLLDARAANRFAGEDETIDPVAGHVPGAKNRPFSQNLSPSGTFRSPQELKGEFERFIPGGNPYPLVHMCGSGITACHNLFAMELAGLPGSRLYAGSWSEWIRDEARPVATGPT